MTSLNMGMWVNHIVDRFNLSTAYFESGTDRYTYWVGGMWSPEAFITATRQHVAQVLYCSVYLVGIETCVCDCLFYGNI